MESANLAPAPSLRVHAEAGAPRCTRRVAPCARAQALALDDAARVRLLSRQDSTRWFLCLLTPAFRLGRTDREPGTDDGIGPRDAVGRRPRTASRARSSIRGG